MTGPTHHTSRRRVRRTTRPVAGRGRRRELRAWRREVRAGRREVPTGHRTLRTGRRPPGTSRRARAGVRAGLRADVRTGLHPGGRGSPGRRATSAAWLRRALWTVALTLTGGVTRHGRLPRGGCVVVANHSSHADTAALLAALDARHAPLIGAAADYWFATPWRRRICRRLAAGFPVRRTGGGFDDLLGTADALRAGRAVVLFPEGTRGRDSTVGDFRRGALLLAERAGVPVVPVGLAGTDRLLPKHGGLRRTHLRVHIGAPLYGAVTPAAARDAVRSLASRAAAAPLPDSRLRRRTAAVVTSRWGLPLAFAWAFAEALSWPLMPELFLALACAAAPRAGLRLSLTALAGSLAGGLLALQLAASGAHLPAPLTTDRMRAEVSRQLAHEGASAVRHQPWDGIPYKVYAAEAGRAHLPAADWLLASAEARGGRTLTVGLAFAALGAVGRPWRRRYPLYLGLLGGGFAVGLGLIVDGWS
ncbi:lysophospholipid acyltransferase family protein [Streptomyces gilvosporeus]|uniref:1-acyl-sn-glycerol-3-phosphate acyltransferase n=1 Tax=Streptomyces gilvosporeus TaxID=553510 RepID=A0A1V0TX86_9ACTN|nr:lysophospholipid acyltransferase family protein [Streptomyces gilvosporeus]ARF57566.1 1-acyl-sn-glycerol-3-phosphate acyltransferase [Streptomyces gilvosporeus]